MKKIFILTSLIFVLVQTQVSAQGSVCPYPGNSLIGETSDFISESIWIENNTVTEKVPTTTQEGRTVLDLNIFINHCSNTREFRIDVSIVCKDMKYSICDINGNILDSGEIIDKETFITLERQGSGRFVFFTITGKGIKAESRKYSI